MDGLFNDNLTELKTFDIEDKSYQKKLALKAVYINITEFIQSHTFMYSFS
jgi:hypothetical protein